MMCMRMTGAATMEDRVAAGLDFSESDITAEGIYGDYFFESGTEAEKVFSCSYKFGASPNPLTHEDEFFLMMGLNSKYDGEGVRTLGRPKASVVVTLDVSGSMGDYMQRSGNGGSSAERCSKLEAAKLAFDAMIDHLRPTDQLGIVTFDDKGKVILPLTMMSNVDKEKLKATIHKLTPGDDTDLGKGYTTAEEMLKALPPVESANSEERRIIFLTDMHPNCGEFSETGLFGLAKRCASAGIFSTFIGIGLDFDTNLVQKITTGVKGSSYDSVKSAESFKQKLDRDMDYSLLPLVFDLSVSARSSGFQITGVYGSPEGNSEVAKAASTGENVPLLKMGTLFPSAKGEAGMTHGGVILLKLSKTDLAKQDGDVVGVEKRKIDFHVEYETRDGDHCINTEPISYPESTVPFFENLSVRKAILLARYVDVMKDWLKSKNQETLQTFIHHFEEEANIINDAQLKKELETMKKVLENAIHPKPATAAPRQRMYFM